MSKFDELLADLKQIQNIDFTESAWATRPSTDFGTASIDFETVGDDGDDTKVTRIFSASVHAFLHGKKPETVAEIERVLTKHLRNGWRMNLSRFEEQTGLTHFEWTFDIGE